MSTLVTQPHFFKPLIPGFQDEFLIPPPFLKYLNGNECQLRSRCGKVWLVEINGRRFENGWKEFVEDHDLQIGDFLVFRYEGDMVFDVLVFDRSTCEREYLPDIKEEGFEILDRNWSNCISNGKELEETKNVETSLIENDSSSALDHPYCKIKLSPHSLRKSRLYIPRDFARLCGLYGRSCSMVLEDEEENCWPAKLLYRTNDDKFIIGDGWGDFHSFHKLKAGDTLMIELIKLGETPVMKICRVREHPEVTREQLKFQNNAELGSSSLQQIRANSEASELRKSQPKTPELAKESCSSMIVSSIGKSKKYKDSGAKANSSSVIQKDFFVAKVTDFTCKSSKLYIPVKFARLHFENKKCCKVILIDQEGRSFTAYSWHKSFVEEAYITDGWKEFSDANNLKIGDSFVFEFIGNEERPVLQMRGFKAGNDQEAAASSKEKPYIYVTLQASHARMGQFKPPVNFARTCGLAKCSAVTIENETGSSWIVALRLDKHNEVHMTYGWPEFVKENGIEEGHVFKLELIKDGMKPELKYYALKQEMGSNQKEACEDFNDFSFWRC